jgi:hypothetical protein
VADDKAGEARLGFHEDGESSGGSCAEIVEFFADGDGIAAGAEFEEGDERFVEGVATEVAGDGHAEESVAGVKLAVGELFADIRPADLAVEGNGEALLAEVALLKSDNEGRRINQWNKPDFKKRSLHLQLPSAATGDARINDVRSCDHSHLLVCRDKYALELFMMEIHNKNSFY